jgi:type III pantothenate kinase
LLNNQKLKMRDVCIFFLFLKIELNKQTQLLVFTNETPIPIKNMYESAQTLGSDRLAAAIGGYTLFPNQHVLVIDVGTCIKYNFTTNKNEYIGGGISPGLKMRLKALTTFTSRLPLVEIDENFDTLIGKNTNDSILSGVIMGCIAEMEGIIERYQLLYPDMKIILTGGDTNFFEKRLKKPIFADQNLILKGLNEILEYN